MSFAMTARAVALALLLLALPARAQDVFVVGPVPVDATAPTAAAARDQARAEGQRRGFRQLLERLTPAEEHRRLPRPDDATVSNALQDFSVANERSSGTRYLADLTFRFRADDVRQLLRGAGIPFAETRSKPVVVLAVFTGEGGPVLWDSPNPWRDAWANEKGDRGLVPLVVPVGDLADLAAIDAEQALAGDTAALEKIAAAHGGGDVLVTQARERDGTLEIATTRYGSGGPRNARHTLRANPGEGEAELMARGVAAAKNDVEETWKRENVLRFGQEASLTVTVPIGELADWVAVRERLAGVAAIRKAEIAALSRGEVRLDLQYVGDADQLRLALAQRDLVLAPGEPFWTLRPRGAARRP